MTARRTRLGPTARDVVFERDGFACRKCSDDADLELHHILEVAKGGTNDPANLITLCKACHYEWTHLHTIRSIPFETWLLYPPAEIIASMVMFLADRYPDEPTGRIAETLKANRTTTGEAKRAARAKDL